jgi:hypothetical protein
MQTIVIVAKFSRNLIHSRVNPVPKLEEEEEEEEEECLDQPFTTCSKKYHI